MRTSDDFAHLPADVRPIASMDVEARIAHIRTERWVQHDSVSRLLRELQDIFDQAPRERMENLLLLGASGMGKTMLIRKFERENAVAFDQKNGIQQKPVLVVLMPPQPTETEFFHRVLETVGAPTFQYWSNSTHLRSTAIALLRKIGTRVLVIDEINSILVGTPRQQRLFLQLLRFLSNDLRMALVGVGVPEARHALLSDSQLRSRFNDVELSLWTPGAELREFITRLVWSLPLRRPSPIDTVKFRANLVRQSGGITLGICKAIARAAIASILTGQERIEPSSFDDPEIWRGIATGNRAALSKPAAH